MGRFRYTLTVWGGAFAATAVLALFILLINERDHDRSPAYASPIMLETMSFTPTEPRKPDPPEEVLPEEIVETEEEDPEEPLSDLIDLPLPEVRDIVGSTLDASVDVSITEGLRAQPLPTPAATGLVEEKTFTAEPSVFDEWQVERRPKQLNEPKLEYPRRAERREIQGHVVLRFVVSEEGRATDITVDQAKPRGFFEKAAQDALRRTRFEPATYRGRRVACRAKQTFYFRIDG